MALVVEDGTIVAGANSYNSLAELRAYASSRGVTLGVDSVIEAQSLQAMDYLESLNYKGTPVEPDVQDLTFPRTGIHLDGRYLAADTIPKNLKSAQAQLVIELVNGTTFWSNTTAGAVLPDKVKKEKVDVIEVEYMTAEDQGATQVLEVASMPQVHALLRRLLNSFAPTMSYRV
jgi:hypothetical protein